MKKVAFALAGMLAVATVYAQPEPGRFSLAVSTGTAVALDKLGSTPFFLQATGYYGVSRRFAVGAGTGLSVYEKALLPLYGAAKIRLARPRRLTPYAECGAGYSLGLSPRSRGGLFLSPSVGVEIRAGSGFGLTFSAGYDLQNMQRMKAFRDDNFAAEFHERLRHRSVSLRVGLLFW